jgi:RNA polymerase sigma-70 factor, ECF subfamily
MNSVDRSGLSPDNLAKCCAGKDSARAWEEFMRRYHPILTAAAIRVSRRWGSGTIEETDDIVQDIYVHLCANNARILAAYRDPRPEAMFGFLKAVATNLAHDFFRARYAAKRGAGKEESVEYAEALPAPSSDIDRHISLAEIDRMLESQTENTHNGGRDRSVFRLYYRHGLTARAIAELPGIGLNTKGVEGVVFRLTRSIRNAFAGNNGPFLSDITSGTSGLGAQGTSVE